MKKSNLSYAEGFLGIQARAAKDKPLMVFDWDKAAEIIKSNLEKYPNLRAEAGHFAGRWKRVRPEFPQSGYLHRYNFRSC